VPKIFAIAVVLLFQLAIAPNTFAGQRGEAPYYQIPPATEAGGCYYYRGREYCGRYCYVEFNGKRYCQRFQRDAHPQMPIINPAPSFK
jgi:hypothetical protein